MDVFGTLPGWVIVLLALLLAGVVLVQNIGWLLAARGLLEAARRGRPADGDRTPDRPVGGP